jgi:glycine cleavage system H protein
VSFDVPDDLRYLESHEYAQATDGTARIGITDFAQDELGDIVFVDLPEVGTQVSRGDDFGVIESIKAVQDLYSPVSGEVVDVNDDLTDTPELVNDDPFGDGWMIEVELTDESELDDLLDADAYEEQIA